MTEDIKKIISDFVDFVMPELKPHETAVYFVFTKKKLPRELHRRNKNWSTDYGTAVWPRQTRLGSCQKSLNTTT